MSGLQRCHWCTEDPTYQDYHDNEWGVASHDDDYLFEMLSLEGMQAGLNWLSVLKKREALRQRFHHFVPEQVAKMPQAEIEAMLQDPAIIRNRRKCESVVHNAQCFLQLQKQHGSFAGFLWKFVDGTPIINHWQSADAVPAQTSLSQKLSRALKQAGFKFVGPVICYAYMQAVGMVDDHTADCFKRL